MRYDTLWWMEHAATYRETFARKPQYDRQEQAILDLACKAHAETPLTSVLEVGCGFGRITRLINDALKPDLHVATDVAVQMIIEARKYLGDRPVVLTSLDLDDGMDQGPADLVIAVEVLMHRPPAVIAEDVRKLCAMSEGWVLTADWYGDTREAEGCWQHDYPMLFRPYGVTETIMLERQAVFLTRRADGDSHATAA